MYNAAWEVRGVGGGGGGGSGGSGWPQRRQNFQSIAHGQFPLLSVYVCAKTKAQDLKSCLHTAIANAMRK